jgi:hypothetical protein
MSDELTFLADAGVSIAWCQTMPVLAYWLPSRLLIILNATADRDQLVAEAQRLLAECPL